MQFLVVGKERGVALTYRYPSNTTAADDVYTNFKWKVFECLAIEFNDIGSIGGSSLDDLWPSSFPG